MSEKSNLMYFLNSIKDILPFKAKNDLKHKIEKDKDFRIKIQKLVYLSKYFGWDNNYHFNFHVNGPYSTTLSSDYRDINFINENCEIIPKIKLKEFKTFIKDHDINVLEAESTLLYYVNKMNLKSINITESINILKYLKTHIPTDIASNSFNNIMNFDLFNQNINNENFEDLIKLETIVEDKSKGLMDIFETFEISSNRLFILGSLDYFRIVLDKENLDDTSKKELLSRLYEYAETVEKEYFKNYSNIHNLAYLDISTLKNDFNELEKFVSFELKIMPKLDANSDLSSFF